MELTEFRDLAVSALVLAFLFSYQGFDMAAMAGTLLVALIAVSLSFICHELAHRAVSRHFDCYSEYKIWMHGVLLALIVTIITNGAFVFAALGAVYIHPRIDLWGKSVPLTRKKSALISLSGPVVNIGLAGLFIILGLVSGYSTLAYLGARINIWLAAFNMIPLPPLDGAEVLRWNKAVWLAFFILCIAMLVIL